MNPIKYLLLLSIVFLGVSVTVAQSEWLVSEDAPEAWGEEVVGETGRNVTWQAPLSGMAQAIVRDNDPKCHRQNGTPVWDSGLVVEIERANATVETYPIPTAPSRNPNDVCGEPVDNLYSSRQFTLSLGDTVHSISGEDSGHFALRFATNTPTSTETATSTATPTSTATAVILCCPDVETATPTVVPTLSPVPPTGEQPIEEPRRLIYLPLVNQ